MTQTQRTRPVARVIPENPNNAPAVQKADHTETDELLDEIDALLTEEQEHLTRYRQVSGQ